MLHGPAFFGGGPLENRAQRYVGFKVLERLGAIGWWRGHEGEIMKRKETQIEEGGVKGAGGKRFPGPRRLHRCFSPADRPPYLVLVVRALPCRSGSFR